MFNVIINGAPFSGSKTVTALAIRHVRGKIFQVVLHGDSYRIFTTQSICNSSDTDVKYIVTTFYSVHFL